MKGEFPSVVGGQLLFFSCCCCFVFVFLSPTNGMLCG